MQKTSYMLEISGWCKIPCKSSEKPCFKGVFGGVYPVFLRIAGYRVAKNVAEMWRNSDVFHREIRVDFYPLIRSYLFMTKSTITCVFTFMFSLSNTPRTISSVNSWTYAR